MDNIGFRLIILCTLCKVNSCKTHNMEMACGLASIKRQHKIEIINHFFLLNYVYYLNSVCSFLLVIHCSPQSTIWHLLILIYALKTFTLSIQLVHMTLTCSCASVVYFLPHNDLGSLIYQRDKTCSIKCGVLIEQINAHKCGRLKLGAGMPCEIMW